MSLKAPPGFTDLLIELTGTLRGRELRGGRASAPLTRPQSSADKGA